MNKTGITVKHLGAKAKKKAPKKPRLTENQKLRQALTEAIDMLRTTVQHHKAMWDLSGSGSLERYEAMAASKPKKKAANV